MHPPLPAGRKMRISHHFKKSRVSARQRLDRFALALLHNCLEGIRRYAFSLLRKDRQDEIERVG